MSVDLAAALLRALSFIAMLQAAGVPLFIVGCGNLGSDSGVAIRRIGSRAAAAGLILVALHYALEPARLSGSFTGILDARLHELMLSSTLAHSAALRVVGLGVVLIGLQMRSRAANLIAIAGTLCVVASFSLVGHTQEHPARWLAASALVVHIAVGAFWYGGLLPLYVATQRESSIAAADCVARFTRIATLAVPALFVAGVALAAMLLPGWSSLTDTYGQLLLVKVGGFALLMGLASLNKWRYGPALKESAKAAQTLRRVIVAEYLIIAGVLAVTAVMTMLYSPQ